jgi:hypothetical protein
MAGITSQSQIRLDESAPAVAGAYVGFYLTILDQTRMILSYSANRESVMDGRFTTMSACTSSNISLCPPSSFWTVTTGDIYDVRVESNGAGIWLPVGGCTARTVSGIQTCAKHEGSLILHTVAKIEARVLFQIIFSINNPQQYQQGQNVTLSVSGTTPFGEQLSTGRVLRVDTEPNFLILNVSDNSMVVGGVNTLVLIFLSNVDFAWPASITIGGLIGPQTSSTNALPLTGPDAAFFGSMGQWRQTEGVLILQLVNDTVIKSGTNNKDLEIQSSGSGYVDGDLITADYQNCSDFAGSVRTDAGGSIIQVLLSSAGFCNYADPDFVIVYPGTTTPIQYTIPKVLEILRFVRLNFH